MSRFSFPLKGSLFILLTGLSLSLPSSAFAQSWSIIPVPKAETSSTSVPPALTGPRALTVGPDGSIYVSESVLYPNEEHSLNQSRVLKRDSIGHWSVLALEGRGLGQVRAPAGLTLDAQGSLYVADFGNRRLLIRTTQGDWSIINPLPDPPYDNFGPRDVAFDREGNLYVAGWGHLHRRDIQGYWSSEGTWGYEPGKMWAAASVAPISKGPIWLSEVQGLYDNSQNRLQMRNPEGQWTVDAPETEALGIVADAEGNLYTAEPHLHQVRRRDPAGHWTVLASEGTGLGQVDTPSDVALDAQENLYVADAGNGRVLKYSPRSLSVPLPGDLDADGQVGIADATRLLRLVVGLSKPSSFQSASGDLNLDGHLSLLDAVLLLQRITGTS